jgi:soluble lytic murein transglycosylase
LILSALCAACAILLLQSVVVQAPPLPAGSAGAPLAQSFGAWAAPLSADDAGPTFSRADGLRRLGDRENAIAVLEPLLDSGDPGIAAEAGARIGLLRLELERPAEAVATLEGTVARFPRAPSADRATFLLGIARQRAGDCGGSIATLDPLAGRVGDLAGYIDLQIVACQRQLGDDGAIVARAQRVLDRGGVRLLRIDALEWQTAALERLGDLEEALARNNQLLNLASAASYRAERRVVAARLQSALGRTGAAIEQLVGAVSDAPASRTAVAALDRLVELQALDRVSYYQAGLVRFSSGDYAAARRNFDGALATPSEAANGPDAAFYRAVSRIRQGEELAGAADLLALPGAYPASARAAEALLRGGKVLESNGKLAEAAQAYSRLVGDFSGSAAAAEGRFRLGFVNLLRGAVADARGDWAQAGAVDGPAEPRTMSLLWQGKLAAKAGDQAAAAAVWQQAVDQAPGWYGSLRAADLLAGRANPVSSGPPLDPARADPSPADLAELEAWTADRGARLSELVPELAQERGLGLADELLAVGLRTEAGWELAELNARWSGDASHLAALALALHERGLDTLALRQAQIALDAARIGARQAPTALLKMLYPLPYAELFAGVAGRRGVDPLLLAALVWQESKYDPNARSVAGALGLTQVLPSTGQGIAAALKRPAIQDADLFKPALSLEFGAYYLGERLRRYGGALLPSLAAYNAGGGAVDGWLRDVSGEDEDLFAERIPYPETAHYVKIVYETAGFYRRLYGAG